MNDLQPFIHGEEGTHGACDTRMKKEGGKSRCCECIPHEDCDNTAKKVKPMTTLNTLIEEKIKEFEKEFDSYLRSVQNFAMIHGHPEFKGKRFMNEALKEILYSVAQATVEAIQNKEMKNMSREAGGSENCDCILCNCPHKKISCCRYHAVEEKKKVKEICDICTKKCLPILKENPGLRAYEYCMNGLCRHIHTDIFGDNGTNG